MRRLHSSLAGLVGVIVMTAACGGGSNPPPAGNTGTAAPSASAPGNVSADKNSYPVFTNPDAGADPAVTAEQGGKGFKGEGWETNTNFDLLGDPTHRRGLETHGDEKLAGSVLDKHPHLIALTSPPRRWGHDGLV